MGADARDITSASREVRTLLFETDVGAVVVSPSLWLLDSKEWVMDAPSSCCEERLDTQDSRRSGR